MDGGHCASIGDSLSRGYIRHSLASPRCPPARWPIRKTTKPILTTSSKASCHRCQTWIIDVFVEHVNAHYQSQPFRLERGDSCTKSTSGSACSSPASSGPWPTIRTRGDYGRCGESAGWAPRGRPNTSASCSCSGVWTLAPAHTCAGCPIPGFHAVGPRLCEFRGLSCVAYADEGFPVPFHLDEIHERSSGAPRRLRVYY